MNASTARAADSPIGAHAMLQLDTPVPFMQRMFEEAAAMHASSIRLDVQPALVFTTLGGSPDFSGLDEVMALSQQYHLRVVADLLSIPWWLANCPQPVDWSQLVRCGTDDEAGYQSVIAQIVGRADPVIRDWEIWNEPDGSGFFGGTPQQYAKMLRAAHDAIKQVDPEASVVLGGISSTAGMSWLAQVFATPDADAAHAFDVANVHERARLSGLGPDIASWRQFFSRYHFAGPLWVTEHGYPADPTYQYDPAYAGGEASQAAFLTASIPTMIDAGADEVFVTERDNLGGQFESEGVLGGDVLDPPSNDPSVIEKPSFAAVSKLAQCYAAFARDCPGPLPSASPGTITFPATVVGSSAATTTVSVSNPGLEPLRLGQVSVAGGSAAGVAMDGDGCSGQLLEPAQSCTVSVHYAPAAPGPVSASLEVPSDNGALSVPVSAFAPSASDLTWSAPAFAATGAFVRAGEVQRTTVQVTNRSAFAVPLAGAQLAPGSAAAFSIAADACPSGQLAPGASCRLTIVFRPRRPWPVGATLALSGGGAQLQISLSARPFTPPAIMRPAAAARVRKQVLVVTDQPASVRWRVLGRGSGFARGRTATVAAARLIHGTGKSVAWIALPRALRPGTYLLSVSPSNAHGLGATETVALKVVR